ncbi:MAG TPA: hypothetical protein VKB88_44860 [Bryobacteraceae bacterium]|nr:hypothetical protein [Bryobacteraceae bacterium]
MNRLPGPLAVLCLLSGMSGSAQVIEFDSNGLKYQTLSKSGITVMFAHLPTRLHEYATIQVAVSNGSKGPYTIKPEDFTYELPGGATIRAVPAKTIVQMLEQKGSGADVVKLITTYEAGLYGNPHFRSTNGYESRRQAALAWNSTKLKAAAAASALALAQTKLAPSESTDGAVFFPTEGKPLVGGRLVVRTNTDTFEFNPETVLPHSGNL